MLLTEARHTLTILALGRMRLADLKFKTRLGYRGRPCLKRRNKKSKQSNQKAKSSFSFFLF
jgi:hypothetical protein